MAIQLLPGFVVSMNEPEADAASDVYAYLASLPCPGDDDLDYLDGSFVTRGETEGIGERDNGVLLRANVAWAKLDAVTSHRDEIASWRWVCSRTAFDVVQGMLA